MSTSTSSPTDIKKIQQKIIILVARSSLVLPKTEEDTTADGYQTYSFFLSQYVHVPSFQFCCKQSPTKMKMSMSTIKLTSTAILFCNIFCSAELRKVSAFTVSRHILLQTSRSPNDCTNALRTKCQPKHYLSKKCTSLRGIDFEAIEEDEECDFFLADDSRALDLPSKCTELPMPNTSMTPEEVVLTCMSCLQTNNEPRPNSGLEVCYNFSSDSCRAANGGSLESFLQYANNPVFQSMVELDDWEVLSIGPEILGTNTRGAMQTVLINVVQKKIAGQHRNDRKFLWTLMKERRPPRAGFNLVHECIAVENALSQTF